MLGRMGWAAAACAVGMVAQAPGIALSAARARPHHPAAPAATPGSQTYRGHTSQHQPIAFTIASGKITNLRFWIVITCASRHRYRLRASRFAPITIRSGRFQATLRSRHPAASATVTGRLRSRRVSGTLRLRRYVAAEHGACSGTATYAAGRSSP